MLTLVFFIFIGFGVAAALFISVQAKRRKDGKKERPSRVSGDTPTVGRATGSGDD